MADLSDISAAQAVKIVGSDSTGVEQTPVNSTLLGELKINDTNSTNRAQLTQLTDGINDVSVKASSTLALVTDKALVVTIRESGQKTMINSTPIVIASDQTTIPVSIQNVNSAPPQSNQIGSYSNNNQVFSLSGNFNAAVAGLNNPIYLIKNPITNTKSLYLNKIIGGTSVTNVNVNFKLFASPVITTDGTVRAPVNNKINSGIVSNILAYSLATISSSGIELRNSMNGQNANSVILLDDSAIIVPPGSNILITANPSSHNREVVVHVTWIEI